MANYTKNVTLGGQWAKASELKSGMKAKIMSETNPVPSTFLNKDGSMKTQDVCKIKFEGLNDVLNLSLNRATINALVDAFGEDSKAWMNQVLTVETERVRVAGKAVVALYLLPSGYQKVDDDNGYAVIAKTGTPVETIKQDPDDIPIVGDDEMNKDVILPF